MSLFLCQDQTALITEALQYSWESECVIRSTLLFFLRIVLVTQGLLCFHTSFRIIYPGPMGKNVIGILIETALNL